MATRRRLLPPTRHDGEPDQARRLHRARRRRSLLPHPQPDVRRHGRRPDRPRAVAGPGRRAARCWPGSRSSTGSRSRPRRRRWPSSSVASTPPTATPSRAGSARSAEPGRRSTAPSARATRRAPPGYFAWEAAGLEWLRDAGGAPVVEVRGRYRRAPLARSGCRRWPRTRELPVRSVAPWRAPTTPAPTRGAAARPAGRVTGSSGRWRSPSRSPWAPGRPGARSTPRPGWRRWSAAAATPGCTTPGHAVLDRLVGRVGAGELRHRRQAGPDPRRPVVGQRDVDPDGRHRSSTRPRTAVTARPTWPCWRCSAHRTSTTILAGYDEVHPPAAGTGERVGLHQLHCLLVHAELFGGGYAARPSESRVR